MAQRLPDGTIQMSDGRVVYANSLIQAQDLIEMLPLLTPPPAWPFVSGGGGGGGSGSGTPGARGADGAPGAPGPQGPQGTNPGPAGPQGSLGAQGNQGNAGAGFQGPQGVAGTQGHQGVQGAANGGAQGYQGNQGTAGSLGVQGFQGFQGTANGGAQGYQGYQGGQGNQGVSGSGAQGNQGNQGPAGGGGVTMAEVLLGKDFFSAQGLLPANTIVEALNDVPAASFENSITKVALMSRWKVSVASPCNFGYSLGGSFDKCLVIFGLTRPVNFGTGVFIGQTTPGTGQPPQGYFGTADIFYGGPTIQKCDGAGTNTQLVTDTSITFPGPSGPNVSQALYYNKLTNRIIYFLRFGDDQWFPALDITDASFSGQAVCAGFGMFLSAPMWVGCPIGIYAE